MTEFLASLPFWTIWVVLGPAMVGGSLWTNHRFAPHDEAE